MSDELLDKIRDDIKKTGFPFELEIGNILNKLDWRVSHSVAFQDLTTSKSREIDIFATKNFVDDTLKLYTEFNLVLEAKKMNKYPWVIFTTPNYYKGFGYRQLHHGFNYKKNGRALFAAEAIDKDYIFNEKSRIGINFYEAFKQQNSDENSKIFDAILSVCKAAYYLNDRYSPLSKEQEFCKQESVELYFYLPVIALEGNLFEAHLEENEIKINKSLWEPLEYNIASENLENKHEVFLPSIVTKEYLHEYFYKIGRWIDNVNNRFIEILKKEM